MRWFLVKDERQRECFKLAVSEDEKRRRAVVDNEMQYQVRGVCPLEGCGHWRGVATGGVWPLEGCGHWRGVATGVAWPLEGRGHWRGVATGGARPLEGHGHWRGVATREV